MHRHLVSFTVLAAAAACGNGDRIPPPPPAAAALAHASQADLAREIAEADRLGTWHELEQRWQGQTVRWTVTRQAVLCGSADDCNVAAFPIQRPAEHGWMPEVRFAPGQYDVLAGVCRGRASCEVTVEGTLGQLEVSAELPTRVQLSNVRIVSPAAAPGGSPRTQTARS
jgi:hypothetical protein